MSSSGVEHGVVVAVSEPPRGNPSQFAFACAILASMTSIILGYGLTIGGAFLLLAGVALAAWVFFFTFLPETRGMPLEEMESLFGSYTANKKKNVAVNSKGHDEQ